MWDFLWSGGMDKKYHLVKWKDVCRPKAYKGLGVGFLKEKNLVPLMKWLWHFSKERGSLWHSIIQSKYGLDPNGWDCSRTASQFTSFPWKHIILLFPLFSPYVRFIVGNGKNIRFWKDH